MTQLNKPMGYVFEVAHIRTIFMRFYYGHVIGNVINEYALLWAIYSGKVVYQIKRNRNRLDIYQFANKLTGRTAVVYRKNFAPPRFLCETFRPLLALAPHIKGPLTFEFKLKAFDSNFISPNQETFTTSPLHFTRVHLSSPVLLGDNRCYQFNLKGFAEILSRRVEGKKRCRRRY